MAKASTTKIERGGRRARKRSDSAAASCVKPFLRLEPTASERSIFRRAFQLTSQDESNYPLAARLLEQAHKEGDRRATYALATWYIHGRHFSIEARKAFRLLKQSGEAGISEALFDLGNSYEVGFGTKKSPAKALECYIEAAARGDRQAAVEVCRCVFWGIGTQRNRKLAHLIDDLVQSRIRFPEQQEQAVFHSGTKRAHKKQMTK